MSLNRYVAALVILLLALPAILISYRVISLGYPLFPAAPERVWLISLNARVSDAAKGVNAVIALPSYKQGITLLEEKITEGTLDFSLQTEGQNRYGIWSGTAGPEGTPISYSATFIVRSGYPAPVQPATINPYPEGVVREEQMLAEKLMSKSMLLPLPARIQAIVSAGSGNWNTSQQTAQDLEKWSVIQQKLGNAKSLLILLKAAGLQANIVEGLALEERVSSETNTWIEVWTGTTWQVIRPETWTIQQKTSALLPLTRGESPAIRQLRGELTDIRWSLNRQIISKWGIQNERVGMTDRLLNRWSLFRLPPEFQTTFRILILVPLGALIVCVLRNVIGFPTFGIFMPVLMALAFRNTGLLSGLGIFAAVLLIGYAVRNSIDKLRLLLVPRLSVILTLVIACFIFFALVGNKFGLREFMAIGLLPFVILTLTIERFHVIIEEQGITEALRTAAGSAAVATIAYFIIQLEPLQLTFFVYPELLFAVMALQILLGRYTGYRLMELLRFGRLGQRS
jgi:hypothetical protein